MNGLLEKLEKEPKSRNSSRETIKSCLYPVGNFLDYCDNKGLNREAVKNYVVKNLEKQNPSSVSKDLFAIKFFFSNLLKVPLELPNPKKNETPLDILRVGEVRRMLKAHRIISKIKQLPSMPRLQL